MEATADNFQLVFAAQLHEVYGIAGNADSQLRIVLRMLHGIVQHITVQYVYVQVVGTFGEVTVHHRYEVLDTVFVRSTQ